jgi:hypothetical protein
MMRPKGLERKGKWHILLHYFVTLLESLRKIVRSLGSPLSTEILIGYLSGSGTAELNCPVAVLEAVCWSVSEDKDLTEWSFTTCEINVIMLAQNTDGTSEFSCGKSSLMAGLTALTTGKSVPRTRKEGNQTHCRREWNTRQANPWQRLHRRG